MTSGSGPKGGTEKQDRCWVVRVNGDWVEARGAIEAVPATTR